VLLLLLLPERPPRNATRMPPRSSYKGFDTLQLTLCLHRRDVVRDLGKMHTFIHSTSVSICNALDTSAERDAGKFAQRTKENEAVHAHNMQRHGMQLRSANKRVGDLGGTAKDLRSFIEREKAKMVSSFSLAERCVALLDRRFTDDLNREREESSGISNDVSTPRQGEASAVYDCLLRVQRNLPTLW